MGCLCGGISGTSVVLEQLTSEEDEVIYQLRREEELSVGHGDQEPRRGDYALEMV